jgi:multimeric flavodoxin WrbA
MSDLYGEILQAHGLVLVTPTHNYNVSVSMKAFIDRLYAFYDFADSRPRTWSSRLGGMGKKAVIAAVCEQMSPYDMGFALEAMERPLQALGYEIVGKLPVLGIFDAGLVAADEEVMARAHKAGEDLVKALED